MARTRLGEAIERIVEFGSFTFRNTKIQPVGLTLIIASFSMIVVVVLI